LGGEGEGAAEVGLRDIGLIEGLGAFHRGLAFTVAAAVTTVATATATTVSPTVATL
jgi:hypothetical protein